MKCVKQFVFVVLIIMAVASCAVSPTGRNQLMIIPDSHMVVMGVRSFHDITDKTPQKRDPAINAYVGCVANAITRLPEVQKASQDWEVVIFDDPSINAFALPGGKIGINMGMLRVATTPGQLSAVIGHEIGHVMARHGNERVSQQFAVGESLKLLDGWLATKNEKSRAMAMSLLGVGAQVGVLLPFSRVQENEADEIGQQLMAKAGFDPRDSVTLWEKMQAQENGKKAEILSTHPSSSSRIKNLKSGKNKTLVFYERIKKSGNRPVCRIPNISR